MSGSKKKRNSRSKPAPATPAKRRFPVEYFFFPLIVLFCIAVYGPSLRFALTDLDDTSLIATFAGRHFQPLDAFAGNAWMEHHGQDFYRPLQSVTFIMDAAISRNAPWSYHRTNIAIHCMTACAMLFFFLLIGFDKWLSLIAVLIFSASPLFANAVCWVPGRGDLLLGLFGITSIASFEKFRRSPNPGWLAVHALSLFLALMSKESAIVLPVLFVALVLLTEGKKALRPRYLPAASAWFTAVVMYLLLRKAAMSPLPSPAMFGIGPFLGNLRVLPETLGALFWPFDLPVLPGFTPARTLTGLLAAGGIIAAFAVQRRPGRPMILFGALWFVLLSIPGMMYRHEFGSRAYDYLNHRAYLPIAGIFIVLAYAVPAKWYVKSRVVFIAVGVVLVALLGILARFQSGFFENQKTFYVQAIRTNPVSALARYNLGKFIYDGGDYRQAIPRFSEAIRLFPGYARAWCNRGNCRGWLGDFPGAIADLEKSVELHPFDAINYSDLGGWKQMAHDPVGALDDYNRSIALNPNFAASYYNRGLIFMQGGKTEAASADFRKALMLNPDLSAAKFALEHLR